MSITSTYAHKVEADFEQFSFPSTVNPKQSHFIDRDDGDTWKFCPVQLEESLSLEELQKLRAELAELEEFMIGLQQRDLRRQTEPGEPEFAGIGGGL